MTYCYNGAMNTVAKTSHAPYPSYCTHDIDAGNTAVKVFFKNAHHHVQVQVFSTPALLEHPRPLLDFLRVQHARRVRWRSSLPPVFQATLKDALEDASNQAPPWVLEPFEKASLAPALDAWHYNLDELGLDRMLHLVAARQQVDAAGVVVISAGTATTVDFMAERIHLGGWIQGGLGVWQSALLEKAPHLRPSRNEQLFFGLGHNTATALGYGGQRPYVLGLAHAVREQVLACFGEEIPTVILTGGHAPALLQAGLEDSLNLPCVHVPDLGAFWPLSAR